MRGVFSGSTHLFLLSRNGKEYCRGVQVHVTDLRKCNPVLVTVALLLAVKRIAGADFQFKEPPYEYETEKMPFDILSGSSELREAIEKDVSLSEIKESWSEGHREFRKFSPVFPGILRRDHEGVCAGSGFRYQAASSYRSYPQGACSGVR